MTTSTTDDARSPGSQGAPAAYFYGLQSHSIRSHLQPSSPTTPTNNYCTYKHANLEHGHTPNHYQALPSFNHSFSHKTQLDTKERGAAATCHSNPLPPSRHPADPGDTQWRSRSSYVNNNNNSNRNIAEPWIAERAELWL